MAAGLLAVAGGALALLAIAPGAPALPRCGRVRGDRGGLGVASVASTARGTAPPTPRAGPRLRLLATSAQLGTVLGLAVVVPLAAARTRSAAVPAAGRRLRDSGSRRRRARGPRRPRHTHGAPELGSGSGPSLMRLEVGDQRGVVAEAGAAPVVGVGRGDGGAGPSTST